MTTFSSIGKPRRSGQRFRRGEPLLFRPYLRIRKFLRHRGERSPEAKGVDPDAWFKSPSPSIAPDRILPTPASVLFLRRRREIRKNKTSDPPPQPSSPAGSVPGIDEKRSPLREQKAFDSFFGSSQNVFFIITQVCQNVKGFSVIRIKKLFPNKTSSLPGFLRHRPPHPGRRINAHTALLDKTWKLCYIVNDSETTVKCKSDRDCFYVVKMNRKGFNYTCRGSDMLCLFPGED